MNNSKDFLGTGFSFPPRIDPVTGRFVMCSADDDIKQSIYIILMTSHKERAMLPDFGSRMRDYVFEVPDITAMILLKEEIIEALYNWEPRIVDVEVDIDAENMLEGKIIIDINYVVRDTNHPGNLVFPYYLYEGVGTE